MGDKIDLNWTLSVEYTFNKYDVFQALEEFCITYAGTVPEDCDPVEFVVDWLETNLAQHIEDFLDILDSTIDTDGELSNENITELLDDEEFMDEFREYLGD